MKIMRRYRDDDNTQTTDATRTHLFMSNYSLLQILIVREVVSATHNIDFIQSITQEVICRISFIYYLSEPNINSIDQFNGSSVCKKVTSCW